MRTLAPELVECLRAADQIEPSLVAALDSARPVNDRSLEVLAEQPDGSVVSLFWAVGDDCELSPIEAPPATWWPVGRVGSTAIVTAGVQSTLALTSITHRADNDGTIWRRPLRGVLSEAVPVALPATTPGLPLEHLRLGDAPGQLVHELADTGITVAFLALPAKEPAGLVEAEPLVDSFVDGFREAAAAVSLEAVFVPLVADMSLVGSLSSVQRGSARDYALAGVLNFWREVARRAPSPGEAQ